jgi:hypothetical protein
MIDFAAVEARGNRSSFGIIVAMLELSHGFDV